MNFSKMNRNERGSLGYIWKARLHHDLTFKVGFWIFGFTYLKTNRIIGIYFENKYWDNFSHIPTLLKAKEGLKIYNPKEESLGNGIYDT